MAFGKNIGMSGLRYKGGGPMFAWLLHRLTAIGILLFVGGHVLASFSMQQFGSEIGTAINIVYESWWFQIIVYFCVMYHATNGLRIVILDLWPQFLKFQREAIWVQWAVFIPIYGLSVFVIVYTALTAGG